jgi:hypothetical protein
MLIICISCFSCEKDEIKSYKKSIVGDWDWEKSTTGHNGNTFSPLITHSPSTTGNNYGFRIKKNGNVFLYENGKQIKKGKLEEVTEEAAWGSDYNGDKYIGSYYHQIIFNFDGEIIIFSDLNGFSCKTWPYNNCPNYFTKIK